MPLILPREYVRCRNGNIVVLSYESTNRTESQISRGGTTLCRKLHYLDRIQNGLCYFAGTKHNSLRKDGLNIIVKLEDIQEPFDFRKIVSELYYNGFLGFNDRVIRKYYPEDDISLI